MGEAFEEGQVASQGQAKVCQVRQAEAAGSLAWAVFGGQACHADSQKSLLESLSPPWVSFSPALHQVLHFVFDLFATAVTALVWL